jgi:hypothetical protein
MIFITRKYTAMSEYFQLDFSYMHFQESVRCSNTTYIVQTVIFLGFEVFAAVVMKMVLGLILCSLIIWGYVGVWYHHGRVCHRWKLMNQLTDLRYLGICIIPLEGTLAFTRFTTARSVWSVLSSRMQRHVVHRRFGKTYSLHFQDQWIRQTKYSARSR